MRRQELETGPRDTPAAKRRHKIAQGASAGEASLKRRALKGRKKHSLYIRSDRLLPCDHRRKKTVTRMHSRNRPQIRPAHQRISSLPNKFTARSKLFKLIA